MNNNCITNQGKEWEKKNSRWIIASFFLFGFASFFYIGTKSKQKKWIISGAIYSVLFFVIFFLRRVLNIETDVTGEGIGYTIYSSVCVIYYLGTIVHSFISKREYLLRLEAIQITGNDKLKEQIDKEYYFNSIQSTNTANNHTHKHNNYCPHCGKMLDENNFCILCQKSICDSIDSLNTKLSVKEDMINSNSSIDINTCGESDFEQLPGVSSVSAKKIIQYRESHGGFNNIDEFLGISALKPHFTIQVREMITCSPKETSSSSKSTDRKLDF